MVAKSLIEVATILAGIASIRSTTCTVCAACFALSIEGIGAFRTVAEAGLVQQVVP